MLTASETDQGVSAYISNPDMPRHADCITIDMFGHPFYHAYEVTGDDNIYFFENDSIDSYAKFFIVTCMDKNSCNFSYGKQFRQRNADESRIMLPSKNGEPDFEYMSNYAKSLMLNGYRKFIAYSDSQETDSTLS